jgi:hypothetical protein
MEAHPNLGEQLHAYLPGQRRNVPLHLQLGEVNVGIAAVAHRKSSEGERRQTPGTHCQFSSTLPRAAGWRGSEPQHGHDGQRSGRGRSKAGR